MSHELKVSSRFFIPPSVQYRPHCLPTFDMGVEIERLTPGDGKTYPSKGDTVKIHYVGTLADGSTFDSSRDRNDPFVTTIGVGKVIKGWDEGVLQLSLGEKAILHVSADYGYGSRGFPPVIPPNAKLNFEVELLGINNLKST